MSTPVSWYDSPLFALGPLSPPSPAGGEGTLVSGTNRFEGHLVHLELLRNGHRVGAVEAGPAELVGGPPTDGPPQPGVGQVGEGGSTDLPAYLLDRTGHRHLRPGP